MVAFNSPRRRNARLFELKFVHSESQLRIHFRQHLEEEQELEQLSAETGIDDEDLLRRFREFGLNGETIAALQFFPIAMVAWASGSITAAELRHAEQAILFSELRGKGKAVEQFQQWLLEKPSKQWWPLWEGSIRATPDVVETKARQPKGRAIFKLAQRIAIASGGVFGFGCICYAEQQVLDRIQQVYALV